MSDPQTTIAGRCWEQVLKPALAWSALIAIVGNLMGLW